MFFTMKFVPLATSLILSSSLLTLARADGTAVVTEPLAADVVDASTSLEVDDATCAYVLTINFKHSDAYPLPPGPEGTFVTGTFLYENKEHKLENTFSLIASSLFFILTSQRAIRRTSRSLTTACHFLPNAIRTCPYRKISGLPLPLITLPLTINLADTLPSTFSQSLITTCTFITCRSRLESI